MNLIFILMKLSHDKVNGKGEIVMRLLGKTLTTVLIVTLLASVATLLMGLFYFFNLPLFELWIVESVALFFETMAKLEIEFRIFDREDHC